MCSWGRARGCCARHLERTDEVEAEEKARIEEVEKKGEEIQMVPPSAASSTTLVGGFSVEEVTAFIEAELEIACVALFCFVVVRICCVGV